MYVAHHGPLTIGQIDALRTLCVGVDLAPGPGGSRITPLTPEQDAVRLDILGRRLGGRAMAVVLYPSSQLVAHRDPPVHGVRYHIPLVVNDGCWVFHAGVWQQLVVGTLYHMDPTGLHGAVNWGSERRLHLIVDVEG